MSGYQRDDRYSGLDEVLDGVIETGVLPYQIPSSASMEDLRLVHSWSEPETGVGWEILVGDS